MTPIVRGYPREGAVDRGRRNDLATSSTRSRRLEDLLALAVVLLAEEKGVTLDDIGQHIWPSQPPASDEVATKLLPIKTVKLRVGLSESTIYRMLNVGAFPKPRKVGGKALWRSDELEAWIVARPVQ